MAETTKIEWADSTFNPWIGCTKVGPPCDFCYAEYLMDRRLGRVEWGPGNDRKRTSAANWKLPLRWNREAAKTGRPHTVFCASLADVWDNEVDQRWRNDLMDLIEQTPALTWLLLSKRIGNAVKMASPLDGGRALPFNAALGATVASQPEWDRDRRKLHEAKQRLGALFSFISVEPMLGRLRLDGDYLPDWVIAGGESGLFARYSHPDWFRWLRDDCAKYGIPFLFKQWGEFAPVEIDRAAYRKPLAKHEGEMLVEADGRFGSFSGYSDRVVVMRRVGKKAAGRLLDGVEHNGFPKEIAA